MPDYKSTLCWDCAKAIGQCSWSNYNTRKPVKGWTATPTIIHQSHMTDVHSFNVTACPEFIKDPPRKKLSDLNHGTEYYKGKRKIK